ncbi:MAG: SH3 domain-containing protein [Microbacteriaceae bacterium]
MRNRTRILTATGLVTASLFAVAGAATAATVGTDAATSNTSASGVPNGIIKQDSTSYTSPSRNSQAVDVLLKGEQVEVICFREGERVNENPVWFKIAKGDRVSYVYRDAIHAPLNLKHCG